jgi:hypothetical protein
MIKRKLNGKKYIGNHISKPTQIIFNIQRQKESTLTTATRSTPKHYKKDPPHSHIPPPPPHSSPSSQPASSLHIRRIHTLHAPQIPNLITAIISRPAAVLELERGAIFHNVRGLAVVAVEEDDSAAPVLAGGVGLDDDGGCYARAVATATTVAVEVMVAEAGAATFDAAVVVETVGGGEGGEGEEGEGVEEYLGGLHLDNGLIGCGDRCKCI